jgi:hypothetical protein
MDFLNELFGSEMGELKRHQKVSDFCASATSARIIPSPSYQHK